MMRRADFPICSANWERKLPVLGELFGEAFSGDEEITLNQNELFISTPDERGLA